MREYYCFQSGSDPGLTAFTDDESGGKLPADTGPWTLIRKVSLDEDWSHTIGRAAVVAGVSANGFSLSFDRTAGQPTSSKPIIESDRVEGTAVFSPAGRQIGTIQRLLIEKVSGRVVYADMVFGGFLGIGTHHHTIPWEKLDYDPGLGGFRTDITEDEVRGSPEFRNDNQSWPDGNREQQTHDDWRTLPPSLRAGPLER